MLLLQCMNRRTTIFCLTCASIGADLQALVSYTSIVRKYPDLALAERARVKRALLLFETGQVQQSIVELEDEEIALRGNAEVQPLHSLCEHKCSAFSYSVPFFVFNLMFPSLFRRDTEEMHCSRCMLHLQPSYTTHTQSSLWRGNGQKCSGTLGASLTRDIQRLSGS